MTSLRVAVDRYLELRRAMGFKLQRAGLLLPDFVRYLDDRGTAFITIRLALDWAHQPGD